MFDRAVSLLYDDGTLRQGSLRFFEQALRYPRDTGYSVAEIASDLAVTPAEAKAYRRNLGRALRWIKDETPGLPDFFEDWSDHGIWRYRVIAPVYVAAQRRGLI